MSTLFTTKATTFQPGVLFPEYLDDVISVETLYQYKSDVDASLMRKIKFEIQRHFTGETFFIENKEKDMGLVEKQRLTPFKDTPAILRDTKKDWNAVY